MFSTQARRLRRIRRSFEELCGLLDEVGETNWVLWARQCRTQLEAPSPRVYQRVLSVYGGMGSFNDLVLQPLNAPGADSSQINRVNERLDALRSQIYTDARSLLFPHRPDRRNV